MESRKLGAAFALAALALAVALFLVLRDEGGSDEPRATKGGARASEGARAPGAGVPLIVVRAGKPVGGVREIEVEKGEPVRLRIRSDQGESVHIHGYEIEEPLGAAGTVTISFPARLDGIYEIELHAHDLGDVELAELVVRP